LTPAAEKIGLEKINFQMFRRRLATDTHYAGLVDKDVQGQMRHANPEITRSVYMQTVPEAQQAAIRMLETNKKPAVKIVTQPKSA